MTTSTTLCRGRGFATADLRARAFVLLAFFYLCWAQAAWAQDIKEVGAVGPQPGPVIGVPEIPIPGPGRIPVSSLSGTVFLDRDGNGRRVEDEPGRDGVEVVLESQGVEIPAAAGLFLRPYCVAILMTIIWPDSSNFCIVSRLVFMMFAKRCMLLS